MNSNALENEFGHWAKNELRRCTAKMVCLMFRLKNEIGGGNGNDHNVRLKS